MLDPLPENSPVPVLDVRYPYRTSRIRKKLFSLLFRIPDAAKIRYPNWTKPYGYRTSHTSTGRFCVRNPNCCQPNFSNALEIFHVPVLRVKIQNRSEALLFSEFLQSIPYALSLLYVNLLFKKKIKIQNKDCLCLAKLFQALVSTTAKKVANLKIVICKKSKIKLYVTTLCPVII